MIPFIFNTKTGKTHQKWRKVDGKGAGGRGASGLGEYSVS